MNRIKPKFEKLSNENDHFFENEILFQIFAGVSPKPVGGDAAAEMIRTNQPT
ncbi:MAG: hypothetical protein JSS02_28595 [Planctomycetes bacterium]|nr:hypothetical protein [Planctomycetota bacterium]